MTQKIMKRLFSVAVCATLGIGVAVAQNAPVFHKYSFEDGAIINGMSDNGKYAVANATSADNSLVQRGARLIEIDTDAVTDLAAGYSANDYFSMGTADVTDDGRIVVGEFDHYPAYWSKESGKWTKLPCEDTDFHGDARAVTPDGKYAVGRQSLDEDGFAALPALWDLTTNTLIETPGVPQYDMSGKTQDQNWFNQITDDGKFILGCISFSYIEDQLYYIYDVENDTYKPIGFTEENKKFTPLVEGLFFINSATFSPNGQWVSGRAYMVKEVEGSQYATQYETTYVYNIATDEFVVYDATEDIDIVASAIDNNGNALGATPSGSPIRNWSVRKGAYWYTFDQILKQQYSMDFTIATGYENTGTPLVVSNDGRRVAVLVDPTSSTYVVELPTTVDEACQGVDLLGSYSVRPIAGSTISRLREITLTFDRDIQVLGAKNSVLIRNSAGETVHSSVGVTANKKELSVRYRSGALSAGEVFTLHIPAGTIALSGDATLKNKEINITYNGRADVPVAVTSVYPAEGTSFARIDNEANPIVLTYDVPVYLPDSAKAYLYNENEESPIATLLMAYSGNVVAVYPATTQYLFKDNNYRIEVMPGSVTDVAGNGASEKFIINYTGSYEREIVYDDNSLLIENFNTAGVANFMLWDGDRLAPNTEAQAIGFDRNDYGWAIAWDESDAANIAASSHSMYEPAGKSDDWMVVPQLYIPDDKCTLKFLSQSYWNIKDDYLKVYVWVNDEVINAVDNDVTARIKSEGVLVYNELQTPGKDENTLAGDWTENTIELTDFAGKNIYIAFLNDNEGQSAVFVDDVQVMHNKPIRIAYTNATSVVAQESILIEGVISIESETETYQSISLTLKDADGNEVDQIEENGLTLKKGDTYKFAFTKALSLKAGEINNFSITAMCNDAQYELAGNVANLAFEPTKHVVVEEYSGRMCSNCPLGFIALEKLEELYGELIIPICIRTYGDDPLGIGLSDYTTFLGVTGAPSAVINRASISYPAASSQGEYYFSNTQLPEGSAPLWADVVAEELNNLTQADINITKLSIDETTNEFVIPCSVRYALNAQNVNLNLFVVILEDDVKTMQMNGFSGSTSAALGEWASGGIYGKGLIYDYPLKDVCRAYAGLTFNGTGGYLPQTMTAGEEYTTELRTTVPSNIEVLSNAKVVVMLIDANTGLVVNATMVKANTMEAVEGVENNTDITISTLDGKVVVNTADNARVEVYGTNGALLNAANGIGCINVEVNSGIAIVKVVTTDNVMVKKVLVK